MAQLSTEKRLDIHNSKIPVLCQECEARHRGVCGALTEQQLLTLSDHTRKTVAAADTELLHEEKEVVHYSNIMGGVTKLTKLMSDGRQQIVGLQFAPDFLGVPFRQQSSLNAHAATDVRLCSFPKKVLDEMIKLSPELEHKLHEQALKELEEARSMMLTLGRKTAAEKVATFLYYLIRQMQPHVVNNQAPEKPIIFELPLKRADIADYLGLTIETVSRQMTKLRKAGVIEIESNRIIRVKNLSHLAAACEAV
jgi:CRP/FNR family transcriptional regulator